MKKSYLMVAILSISIFQLSGCGQTSDEQMSNDNIEDVENVLNADSRLSQSVEEPVLEGDLSDAEILGLQFMREEEKLARDVYVSLYEQWGLMPFKNISKIHDKFDYCW